MTTASAIRQAMGDGDSIVLVTRSGAEYIVYRDILECATDDWHEEDGYVYGNRLNGRLHLRRRRVDTRDQQRWFMLSNTKIKQQEKG